MAKYLWHLGRGLWDRVMERKGRRDDVPATIEQAHRKHLGASDRVEKRRGFLPFHKKGV